MTHAKIADFIAAPNSGGSYTKVLLVVHDTEGQETKGAARGVVAYWNRARTGSTQYVVDGYEIIQAVAERAYAWAAGTTANKFGIHVEHVGYAAQGTKGWDDAYSRAELALSAPLFADLAAKYNIPVRRLTVAQIRHAVQTGNPADGGICGHADISQAFPGETSHTDPGPSFPWDQFIAAVKAAGKAPAPAPAPKPDPYVGGPAVDAAAAALKQAEANAKSAKRTGLLKRVRAALASLRRK
jgi:N-acetyl-anhydromuramyl-L-alanine amidase AmpD